MSETETNDQTSKIRKDWNPESGSDGDGPFFLPDEIDIYVNKMTLEAYFFHGKKIDYSALERLEYDPILHTVDVIKKDGTNQDLGVKIQWLVRPYFSKASEVSIVQTKDGESVDGIILPLSHKNRKP